ncbi:unnamed protein product [Protopolystoma xenopodis]|uniref:Uncharacterized protein n=1 Tax=Protopolystoma xenopodis TaxID=117903 RepID=A0A448XH77_9PLAT|nr:unnamed protein product [Protopolystoma xenopodis]
MAVTNGRPLLAHQEAKDTEAASKTALNPLDLGVQTRSTLRRGLVKEAPQIRPRRIAATGQASKRAAADVPSGPISLSPLPLFPSSSSFSSFSSFSSSSSFVTRASSSKQKCHWSNPVDSIEGSSWPPTISLTSAHHTSSLMPPWLQPHMRDGPLRCGDSSAALSPKLRGQSSMQHPQGDSNSYCASVASSLDMSTNTPYCNQGTRGNVAEWLTCQAHILPCHGSTPAGGVDKSDARSKLQSTGAWMRTTFGEAGLCEIQWKHQADVASGMVAGCSLVWRMAALTDDVDHEAGETFENVPSPPSDAVNHDNYYGGRLQVRCVLLRRPDNKTKLRQRGQPTSM